MQLIVTSYLLEEYLLNWSLRVTLPWPVLFILKFVLTVAPEELMCPTRSLRFDEGLYVSDRLENCNVQYVIWLWNLLNTKWGLIFYINIIVKKSQNLFIHNLFYYIFQIFCIWLHQAFFCFGYWWSGWWTGPWSSCFESATPFKLIHRKSGSFVGFYSIMTGHNI